MISFETSEPLLLNLKAENDKISVKLNSSVQVILLPTGLPLPLICFSLGVRWYFCYEA
jgi:hypothetical protein